MSMAPIKLHWWKAVPNFGDALSPLVVAHVSGRTVEHVGPKRAELWGIGSLMHVVRQNREDLRQRPVIWGTGQLGHVPRDVVEHVDIALLRGPIGAALLGVQGTRFGDPGLLAKDVFGPVERSDVIGLVPHHSQIETPLLAAVLQAVPQVHLIDPRGDCAEVCKQIAACAHVFASSLHGLIVADAYGVANTWVHPSGQSHFKYYDYAASIGRTLPSPLRLESLPDALTNLATEIRYSDGVNAVQEDLYASFPKALLPGREMAGTET